MISIIEGRAGSMVANLTSYCTPTVQLMMMLLLSLSVSGCGVVKCCLSFPLQGGEESVHYFIFGVGVVTVPKPGMEPAVLAVSVQALGLSLSDQPGLKFGLGYSSNSVVAVPDGAEDVRVEISQQPGGPFTINVPKATLERSNSQ